jgi:hypothetical protein
MFAVTSIVSDDYVAKGVNSDAEYHLLRNKMIWTLDGDLITLNASVVLLNTCIQIPERALVMSTQCFTFITI